MMRDKAVVCASCGMGVENGADRPPCEALSGWLMLSHWKGKESVDHHSFCSEECLHDWIHSHLTRVPDVFLKSFDEDDQNRRG